jgi:maltose-binding protein MalE
MANDLAMAEINTMAYASVLQPYLDEMNHYWMPMGNFGAMIMYGDINLDNYEAVVDELNDQMNNIW